MLNGGHPRPHSTSSGIAGRCKGCSSSTIIVDDRCVYDLERRKKVTLLWVPDYVGLQGNEKKTDELMRKGPVVPLVCLEPFWGLGDMIFKWQIRKAVEENRSKFWKEIGRLRQVKKHTPHSRYKVCMSLSRRVLGY